MGLGSPGNLFRHRALILAWVCYLSMTCVSAVASDDMPDLLRSELEDPPDRAGGKEQCWGSAGESLSRIPCFGDCH